MLYLKEMGEDWYSKACAVCLDVRPFLFPPLTSYNQAYFTAASALHNQEMKDLFVAYSTRVKKATDEEMEMSECSVVFVIVKWYSLEHHTQALIPLQFPLFGVLNHSVGLDQWHDHPWTDAGIERSVQRLNFRDRRYVEETRTILRLNFSWSRR